MSFLPIPAIDLMEGQVVRLRRGLAEEKTVYSDDPAGVARGFEEAGAKRLHVVDLDGAFSGAPRNQEALASIRRATGLEIEVGGGLRDEAAVAAVFDLGIDYAIIGTGAVRDRSFVAGLIERYGEKVIIGLDAKGGRVAVEGWVETSELDQLEFAKELESLGVATIIATDVATDGMMSGPSLASLGPLADATRMRLIASGGVRNIEDMKAIEALGHEEIIGAITGRAIYEGTIDVAEAMRAFAH